MKAFRIRKKTLHKLNDRIGKEEINGFMLH